ncbi:hypothetical protein [Lysobacter gummosus]|uniref:hypothetical protein n=1 Tax=Lysobacter gummosus TaxID=262324 RepID=UPI00363ED700
MWQIRDAQRGGFVVLVDAGQHDIGADCAFAAGGDGRRFHAETEIADGPGRGRDGSLRVRADRRRERHQYERAGAISQCAQTPLGDSHMPSPEEDAKDCRPLPAL